MEAYLQFKASHNGPFLTQSAKIQETAIPRKGDTQSGYGRALPTRYKVLYNGRWRRVKCAQYGNAGTFYIGAPGAWLATVDIHR